MPDVPAPQLTFVLTYPITQQSVRGEVMAEGQGLALRLDGYGDQESAQDQGSPVFLEFYDG